jgi:glyoxylase-like metal-dependent hydrolase (beta-lactamase superfamily II)
MRVHHLNCASMCPVLFDQMKTPGTKSDAMICHCLLIETEGGLVLVDTGFGTGDIADPKHLGAGFALVARPKLDVEETALHQLQRLGFSRDDVRHVVPTHLDLDHAGGLPDFPKAKVHVYAKELDAVLERATLKEKSRYRPRHFAHGPDWVRYERHGERWFGFESVRDLEGLPPEILLVPTVGHTRGHVAVAVESDDGWLLHAGDAYFSHLEMSPDSPSCPAALSMFQRLVAMDDVARVRNQERLRLLARDERVSVFCAHDAFELEAALARAE